MQFKNKNKRLFLLKRIASIAAICIINTNKLYVLRIIATHKCMAALNLHYLEMLYCKINFPNVNGNNLTTEETVI